MTRYEIRKNKAKQRRRMIVSLSLIGVGLAMVITAGIMEASHYPWGLLFGTATQNADTIADPSPIVLDEEDKDVIITEEAPSAEASAPAASSEASTDATASSSPSDSAGLPGNEEDTQKAPAVTKYVVLGTLKIPVLKVSQNLLEGAGKQMKYGVGHVPSTVQPGQKGNCAVSGHRPYPFRYLDQLKTGDNIIIKAGGITYTYSVFDSFAVLPTEVWVLNNMPGEDYTLTVITCTPYLVSSHRLIIRARLVDVDGKSPQEYYGEVSAEASPSEIVPSDSAEPAVSDATAEPTPTTEEPAAPPTVPATDSPPSESVSAAVQ